MQALNETRVMAKKQPQELPPNKRHQVTIDPSLARRIYMIAAAPASIAASDADSLDRSPLRARFRVPCNGGH